MDITIRKATANDVKSIHELVTELAIFEKEPDAVKVDVNYYAKCFDDNIFQALVAEVNGEVVGTAVFYMTFSTWKGKMIYLEDFVVKQNFRNKGLGQKLWDAWIKESKVQDAKLVKWQVLDWNVNAIRFYEKNGATIEKEWWNGKIVF